MSDDRDIVKSVITEEERRRLITEISKIKDVLDSFKYGLNFEEFADEIFKTINRQTFAIRNLEEKMTEIAERMERLEMQLKEGIRVKLSAVQSSETGEITEQEFVIAEPKEEPTPEEEAAQKNRTELEAEAAELEIKIAKLFEKENEYTEMSLNDPAGSDEYLRKADVARQMRVEAETRLKEIKEKLQE